MPATPAIPIHYLIASEPRILCSQQDRPEPAIIQYYGRPGLGKITCPQCIGIIREAWERHPPPAEERKDFDRWLKAALASATANSAPPENPAGETTPVT